MVSLDQHQLSYVLQLIMQCVGYESIVLEREEVHHWESNIFKMEMTHTNCGGEEQYANHILIINVRIWYWYDHCFIVSFVSLWVILSTTGIRVQNLIKYSRLWILSDLSRARYMRWWIQIFIHIWGLLGSVCKYMCQLQEPEPTIILATSTEK